MTAPRERWRDPLPLSNGWEIAAAVLATTVLCLGSAAILGLALASLLAGHGWIWPRSESEATQLLGGILTGHPGRNGTNHPASVSTFAAYLGVGLSEALFLALAGGLITLVVRYRRPTDARRGMATSREAKQALGVTALRGARAIIRPDLYGRPLR